MTLTGAAVLATGCGTQVARGPSQPDTLAAAITRTGVQTTRVAMTISTQTPGMSFSYTASGQFDFAHSRGSLSMPQPLGLTALFIPPNVYVKLSSASGGPSLPKGKTWVVTSDSTLGGAGAAFSPLVPFGGGDPADMLKSLTGMSGGEKKLGTATIRGVAVTGYQVNIDPAKAAARLPSSQRESFRQFAAVLGSGAIPVDVWVDGQNLVRRVRVSLHPPASSGVPAGAQFTETTDFYDFGVPVRVAAPPASQVATLAEMIAGTGISGGSSRPNPPRVTGTLTPAQADAAEQAVARFWIALSRNDLGTVMATVLPSQRSCARSDFDGAPPVTVSGLRVISAEPAGNGRATVRFSVDVTVNVGGQKVRLPSMAKGPMWFVAEQNGGHWYVDFSATTDSFFGGSC